MVLNAFFRARLGVLGVICAAALGVCVWQPQGLPVVVGASAFVLSAIIAFVLLRHAGLAVLAAFSPFPGLLIAHASGASDPLTMMLCYLPGLACAMFLSDEIAARIAAGSERRAACQEAFAKSGAAAVAAIAVAAIGLAILSIGAHGYYLLAGTIGAGLSAIVIVPLAATFLPFGEDFVTRANRVREWRERMLDPVTAVTEPRWSMSAAGIAVVFAVLGYFEARPVLDAKEYAVFAALLLAASIAGYGLTWEWRRALACPLVLVMLILIGLWGLSLVHATAGLQPLVQALGICAVPLLFVTSEASRHLTDDAASASSLALLRKGPAAILFFLAGGLVVLAAGGKALNAVIIVLLVFGCAAALLWLPAFTGALETLFPARATIEARYRVH